MKKKGKEIKGINHNEWVPWVLLLLFLWSGWLVTLDLGKRLLSSLTAEVDTALKKVIFSQLLADTDTVVQ